MSETQRATESPDKSPAESPGQRGGGQSERGYRSTRLRRALGAVRNTWRQLTSMRTALMLLFLLALAALPGAFLPQRAVNASKVADYLAEHGWWADVLNRLQFFTVYSSVWFSAIYLLLMISLVGCLMPRSRDYLRAMRAKPVRTPRNLTRMPHYDQAHLDAEPEKVLTVTRKRLRGWRRVERTAEDGSYSISAERGYLRESGNLMFHFAVLGIIIAFAIGKMYAYEGQVIVVADDSQFCNTSTAAYDNFDPGLQVDGTGLAPFCVQVNDFNAEYTATGQPTSFEAALQYQVGESLRTGNWQPYQLEVNEPLRLEQNRIYLLGYGYAPTFTVRFPDGEVRSKTLQWRPANQATMLSRGATTFLPPGAVTEQQRSNNQLAITGLFAPNARFTGTVLSSAGPALTDPAVAVDIYRGQLGASPSIFTIDQSMVEQGKLNRVARVNVPLGESVTLDNGTKITLSGVEKFVSLQITHNPTHLWMLGLAIALLLGLITSLIIKRRRVWVRLTPGPDGGTDRATLVEVGGLARTDQAGYGEEFSRIAEHILGAGKRPG